MHERWNALRFKDLAGSPNMPDGFLRFVEIDRLKKHICIGARNDISMNAVQNADEIARMPKMQNTLYLSNTMNVQG